MSFKDQIYSNIQNAKALIACLESLEPIDSINAEHNGDELAKMQRVALSFHSLQESINLLVKYGKSKTMMEKEPDEKEIKALVTKIKPITSDFKSNNNDSEMMEDSEELSSDGKVQVPINENIVVDSKRSTLATMTSNVFKTASDLYAKNESEGGSKTKMVLTAVSQTILIDENNTLGFYLFGKKFHDFNVGFASRNPKIAFLLMILFFSCLPIVYLSLYEIINPWYSLVMIYFTLWILFFSALQRNFTVFTLLLKNFDTWFGIYNSIGYCVSMMFLVNFDIRSVFFFCLSICFSSNFFDDAIIIFKDRKAQAYVVLFFLITEIVCLYFALILNWYNLTSLKEEIQFSYVHLTVSSFVLSSLQNVLIFRFRLIFNSYMHPEAMVSMRAKMVITKVKESQAFMMLAMEQESIDSKSQNVETI